MPFDPCGSQRNRDRCDPDPLLDSRSFRVALTGTVDISKHSRETGCDKTGAARKLRRSDRVIDPLECVKSARCLG